MVSLTEIHKLSASICLRLTEESESNMRLDRSLVESVLNTRTDSLPKTHGAKTAERRKRGFSSKVRCWTSTASWTRLARWEESDRI